MKKNKLLVHGMLAGAFALVPALVLAMILAGCENPADGESGPGYGVDFSLPDSTKYSSLDGEWVKTGDEGNEFANLSYYQVKDAIDDAMWAYINAVDQASGTIPANTELTMTRGDFNGKKITVLSGSWSMTGWDAVDQGRAGTVTESIAVKFVVTEALTYSSGDRSFTVKEGSKLEIKQTGNRTFAAKTGGGEGRGEETSNINNRESGSSFIVTGAQYTVNNNGSNENVTRNGVLRQWEKQSWGSSSVSKYAGESWVSDKSGKVWYHMANTNERSRNARGTGR